MIYTFVGQKDLIEEEVRKITKDFNSEAIVIYDLEEVPIEKVIEDLNTFSMFGKKLIKVDNLDKINDQEPLIKYIENKGENTLIITSFKELDNRKKLTEILKEKTKFKELFTYDLTSFVKDNLEDYKMSIMAINVLINNADNNIKRIGNELEKLKLYKFKTKEITTDDIEKLVKKGFDSTIFNLIDVINQKDKQRIFKIYNELLEEGETEEKILYTIANHYRLLYQIKEKSKVMRDEDIIREYKMHPYRLTKLKEQSGLVSNGDVLAMLKGLSEVDIAVKSGKKDISTAMFIFFENL